MNRRKVFVSLFIISSISFALLVACSKGDSGTSTGTGSGTDACAGKTIVVSATATQFTDPCGTTSVTITATGSTGFTYSIDGANFQVSNVITKVSAGTYTVTAKDNAGCSKTASITVTAAAGGPLFTAVKAMMQVNCISCHAGNNVNGGKDFSSDCVIVTSSDRIKARAIDGNPSFMPQGGQLSAADKKKISDWINAGGRYSD